MSKILTLTIIVSAASLFSLASQAMFAPKKTSENDPEAAKHISKTSHETEELDD